MNLNGVSTRKEKEEHVLDLYFNQNKTVREIAKITRMSPRDIIEIKNRQIQEKERQEHKSVFLQAYELFLQGKKPIEVAIALNIGETQVSQYYTEYSKLVQLDDVARIYKELKGNVWFFVDLCKSAETEHLSVQHVIELLKIANKNYLLFAKNMNILENR